MPAPGAVVDGMANILSPDLPISPRRMLRAILLASLLATLAFAAAPTATASACTADTDLMDDDGVSAWCGVPVRGETCRIGVGTNDPLAIACTLPVECVREPCY